jgi:hypothetical protein
MASLPPLNEMSIRVVDGKVEVCSNAKAETLPYNGNQALGS